MERLRAERRRRIKPSLFQGDLFRLRWSVGDPDKLFDRWLPRLRFFFSRTFLVISIVLFAMYFLVLGLKWPEFSQALTDLYTFNVDASTLAVFWITSTVIIAIHELGHGFTCKYFGGQVHEIGAMLIYFEPAFFCNVNDAWTFPELKARLWVTAAGSWIQLVLASLGALVWWAAAPGTLASEVALASVLIGGITTVFMNANPLIPLDGYYALSDYLEVPNLRQRAFAHLSWFVKTRVFGLDVPAPAADEREKRIFLTYGLLGMAYITLILTLFGAAAYGWLNRELGVLGICIFVAGLYLMLRSTVREWLRTAGLSYRQHRATWQGRSLRQRAVGLGVAVLVLGLIMPWSITITGPFVAAPALSIPLTAPDSGYVERIQVLEGTRVAAGAPLLQIRNLELERELAIHRRISDSLTLRSAQARGRSQTSELALLEAASVAEQARVAGLRDRVAALRVRALGSGTVVTPRPEQLTGQWVSSGERVLELGQPDTIEIRIALSGAGATSVLPNSQVRLLPDATLRSPITARISTMSAAATSPDAVEARLRLAAPGHWRPGMTGQASVTLRHSNLWGALWWSVRSHLRSDILL
jgi:hypothetical protein